MCERMSVGDPSGTRHAYRGAAAVEEAEAECEPAEVPEQCCSGYPSSTSGAGSTAPGQRRRHRDPSTLVVLPLVVLPLLVRTTPGVHHLIFWTKDFMRKEIAEINSDGYDIFLQENLSMIK